jgi:N-acetylglucosamine kinase-like BadF-type ATPase
MIFIVESGSTKSDWVLLNDKNNQTFYSTMGFNPYFHSSEFIEAELRKNSDIIAVSSEITRIYFYGAGCSSADLNNVVLEGLKKIFPLAEILVDHDLLACAYATYSGNPAISCILGTGSNSCYFDGEQVSEVIPALGYILGDEGSGSYFGKKLLAAYLYHQLTPELSLDLEETYGVSKSNIISRVYQEPNANVYIASFMPFISKHAEHPIFQQMVEAGLKHFMEVHVCCYPNYKEVEVNFVGSIAGVFRAALQRAADSLSIRIGQVIKSPVNGLVTYHINYLIKKELN